MMCPQSNIVNCMILLFVVYSGLQCLYWYDTEDARLNPCGEDDMYVPENAEPIFIEDYS